MAIFYLTNGEIPSEKANGIQVMQMCSAFAQSRQTVTLLCRAGRFRVKDIFEYYGVQPCFEIQPIRVPKTPFIGRLVLAVSTFKRLPWAEQHHIVYAREQFAAGLLCFWPYAKIQVAIEIHSPPINRFWKWWLGLMLRTRRISMVVAISQALAMEISRIYPRLPAGIVFVAHDGANPLSNDFVQPLAHETSRSPPRSKIGYVGSLHPGKGMELIRQLAVLLPDVDFHVVGGSKSEVQIWQAKAPYANIRFYGFVNPSEARQKISEFDVVLAPYQAYVLVGEGKVDVGSWMSPLKLFEYMSHGKPIIASNLPVLREVLMHEQNALLCDPLNVDEWRNAVRRVLNDSNLSLRLGSNARKVFLESCTWNKRAELILRELSLNANWGD